MRFIVALAIQAEVALLLAPDVLARFEQAVSPAKELAPRRFALPLWLLTIYSVLLSWCHRSWCATNAVASVFEASEEETEGGV